MYRAGNGCGNTAEIQGVVVHEWGHGYDQNDGGGYDNTSEAYADVVAIFASRESCVGRGFFADGGTCSGYGDTCTTCTGIRDHDWAARAANVPATPQGFVQGNCPTGSGPCGYSTHCESYPIGEAIFDLATRDLPAAGFDPASAWQLADRLLIQHGKPALRKTIGRKGWGPWRLDVPLVDVFPHSAYLEAKRRTAPP